MSKYLCKNTIYWTLIRFGSRISGEVCIESKKYMLDEELSKILLKRFESGELTGNKFSPKLIDIKITYKRQYFENGKEVKPLFPEYM